MTVRVEGNDNRTAGGNYTEDRSVRVNIGSVSIGAGRDRLADASTEECSRVHSQLAAVRAQLWRMFLRHPTIVPYLLAWLGFGVLVAAFWGDAEPFPHGIILLSWGLLVIGPAGWIMARPREPMYQELLEVRRQLIRAERRLVRLEVERRIAIEPTGDERLALLALLRAGICKGTRNGN